jgi:hypothetical protein
MKVGTFSIPDRLHRARPTTQNPELKTRHFPKRGGGPSFLMCAQCALMLRPLHYALAVIDASSLDC